ncbi:MAG TPA: class I SAM-dependent methyltransferase [Actinomycetota bacterium]
MAATTGIRTTEGWVPNARTESIFGRVSAQEFVGDVDWDAAVARLAPPPMPDYVRSQIHGIEGGYGTTLAAATWDPVVREIFAEYGLDEASVRDGLAARAPAGARRILDVACGTGESTRAWRRRFPEAEIVAFDVSPFMAAVAERKLARDRRTQIRCLDAEAMPFEDGSFDVVTTSLLFHELPAEVAPGVAAEMARVCRRGGALAVLEPYEKGGPALSPIPFPEPYLKDFLAADWDAIFGAAGFTGIAFESFEIGWMRTATRA